MFEKARSLPEDNRKDIIGNILLFSMFFWETVFLYSASFAALFICVIPGIITYIYVRKNERFLLLLMTCIAIGVVTLVTINRITVLNCSWSGSLRIIFISLPISYLLCTVNINRRVGIRFFYMVFVFTIIKIILAGPAKLYRIFNASSRNYISVLLIACLFPYYLACSKDQMEVSVFPALLSFLVSVYVQSRGGIIASGILIALTFIQRITIVKEKEWFKKRKKLFYSLIICLCLLAIVFFVRNGTELFSRFFEAEEYSITRSDMWKEYVTVTLSSVKNILLGPPLTTCPLIFKEANNIHNSYFMTHSYMGIVGFLAVIFGGIGYLVLCINVNFRQTGKPKLKYY